VIDDVGDDAANDEIHKVYLLSEAETTEQFIQQEILVDRMEDFA
jgi:hypothetical protein